MNTNEHLDFYNPDSIYYGNSHHYIQQLEAKVRQQQNEIEDLKNANRFIQNFAEEQHQRAVALEMRELTDEEIMNIFNNWTNSKQEHNLPANNQNYFYQEMLEFARAILKKAQGDV